MKRRNFLSVALLSISTLSFVSGQFPKETSADLSDIGAPIGIEVYFKNLNP